VYHLIYCVCVCVDVQLIRVLPSNLGHLRVLAMWFRALPAFLHFTQPWSAQCLWNVAGLVCVCVCMACVCVCVHNEKNMLKQKSESAFWLLSTLFEYMCVCVCVCVCVLTCRCVMCAIDHRIANRPTFHTHQTASRTNKHCSPILSRGLSLSLSLSLSKYIYIYIYCDTLSWGTE